MNDPYEIRPYLLMKGISRVDSKGGNWFVRINYRNRKPQLQKWFSDKTYGDKTKSLKAAKKWRDKNIDISLIKIKKEHQIENAALENNRLCTPEQAKKWKAEKLSRRLKALEVYGPTTVVVGTGFEAAQKARKLGAGYVTCWKILTGKRNSYMLNSYLPGYHLPWKETGRGRHSNFDLQKKNGKQKVHLGTGREAAIKAMEMGACHLVCSNIMYGRQDFFQCCYTLPHFEANGFKRTIPDDVAREIQILAYKYAFKDAPDIIAEVMLNYSSRLEIPSDAAFVRHLVHRYIKIFKVQKQSIRFGNDRRLSLDIRGDIEHFNGSGESYGTGFDPEPLWASVSQ